MEKVSFLGKNKEDSACFYDVSIVMPSYNEEDNVSEMITRLEDTFLSLNFNVEVLYVDDGQDNTASRVNSTSSPLNISAHHRLDPLGGLSGAVIEGIEKTSGRIVVVMDADLQHPPEVIPLLLEKLQSSDLCVASRYLKGGSSSGLDGKMRTFVSHLSTYAVRCVFPRRLAHCSDPMTGFFAFHRESVDMSDLRPRGFKILLEILASQKLKVAEIPFSFAQRTGGESKASLRQGVEFLKQLLSLRLLRWQTPAVLTLAAIGGLGTVISLLLMALMIGLDINYILASVIASEITIGTNLYLQEKLVFKQPSQRSLLHRTLLWYGFGNIEMVMRTPLLVLLVSVIHLNAVLAQAILLSGFFVLRFLFSSRILYTQKKI